MKFYCREFLKSETPGKVVSIKKRKNRSFHQENVEFMLNCLTEKVKRKHFFGVIKWRFFVTFAPAEQNHRINQKVVTRYETQIENISFQQSQAARVHFKIDPE